MILFCESEFTNYSLLSRNGPRCALHFYLLIDTYYKIIWCLQCPCLIQRTPNSVVLPLGFSFPGKRCWALYQGTHVYICTADTLPVFYLWQHSLWSFWINLRAHIQTASTVHCIGRMFPLLEGGKKQKMGFYSGVWLINQSFLHMP